MTEVIIAAVFVGFLTGFVAVLCIGNYFRAKRAMERQRHRRLARLSNGRNGHIDSPKSQYSSGTGSSGGGGDENQHLLASPDPVPRRRPMEEGTDLLLMSEDSRHAVNLMSV